MHTPRPKPFSWRSSTCWEVSQTLSRFDALHFRDFLWRRFFARTLPSEDFELVTRTAFRVARIPWIAMHICALVTRKMGYPLYPRLDTSDFDIMIAETPYPATVSRNTKLIIRYHDAIPLLMPHTISDRRFHQAFHYRALRKNVASGAWFVCVSDATRKDLVSIFPQAEARSVTIHNMVSHHFTSEPSSREQGSRDCANSDQHEHQTPHGFGDRAKTFRGSCKSRQVRLLAYRVHD